MARSRRLFITMLGLAAALSLYLWMDVTAEAGNDDYREQLRGGVAAVLNPGPTNNS